MKVFRFEMAKLWSQKKLLWLLLIILIAVSGIFLKNYSHQAKISERALEKIDSYIKDTDRSYQILNTLERQNTLDDQQDHQFEHVKGMGQALFHWKSAIYNQE